MPTLSSSRNQAVSGCATAVDLKEPQRRERILELAKESDVVVENFRPGVMDRLGLGYENFRAGPRASAITGATYLVDGGLTAGLSI